MALASAVQNVFSHNEQWICWHITTKMFTSLTNFVTTVNSFANVYLWALTVINQTLH